MNPPLRTDVDLTDSVVLRRTIDHPRSRVFEAWRDQAIMSRWFSAPGWHAHVTSDFRIGGTYRIEMRGPEGRDHVQFGEYLEIEPDRRLVFTWTCPEIGVESSVVAVELVEQSGGTELTIRHTLPADREILGMHEEGWVRCVGQLERVLDEDRESGGKQ